MAPEQLVQVNDVVSVREAVRQYIMDNVGWRAEDRDLVWSHRYVVAKLSLLHNKTMSFQDLVVQVALSLSETQSQVIRSLTPDLIAEKICSPIVDASQSYPDEAGTAD